MRKEKGFISGKGPLGTQKIQLTQVTIKEHSQKLSSESGLKTLLSGNINEISDEQWRQK